MSNRFSWKFVGIAVACLTATVGVMDIIYWLLIVPRLEAMPKAPTLCWLGIATPFLLCSLVVGALSRSIREITVIAVAGGLGALLWHYLAVITHQPGYQKSWAIEGPIDFWTIGLFARVMQCAVPLCVGHVMRIVTRRLKPSTVSRT